MSGSMSSDMNPLELEALSGRYETLSAEYRERSHRRMETIKELVADVATFGDDDYGNDIRSGALGQVETYEALQAVDDALAQQAGQLGSAGRASSGLSLQNEEYQLTQLSGFEAEK
ncbi:hypothetical protein ABZ863_06035 [Saccharomonospora sp. NPDC046836]|uniref:hypothetical protein n=1 Tax=Saccharomonospora sp. NPDC046836 TaxID=3156921 RepID=UPI0033F2CA51